MQKVYGSKFATLPATATDEEKAIARKIALRFAEIIYIIFQPIYRLTA